jgi:hypothetical protein
MSAMGLDSKRVMINSQQHLEAGLVKAQAQSSRAAEEVDGGGISRDLLVVVSQL